MLPFDQNVAELPADLQDWVQGLEDAMMPAATANRYPPGVTQRLLYVLHLIRSDGTPHLSVEVCTARVMMSGGYGATTPYLVENAINSRVLPRYVLPVDMGVLRHLYAERIMHREESFRLHGSSGVVLLEKLLATGRCHFADKAHKPLSKGEARPATLCWDLDASGSQTLRFVTEPRADAILPLDPPWYVDQDAGVAGEIEANVPTTLAAALATAPSVPLEHLDAVRARLQRYEALIPLPRPIRPTKEATVEPVPVLRLTSEHVSDHEENGFFIEAPKVDAAYLSFDYSGAVVPSDAEQVHIIRQEGDDLIHLRRRKDLEREAAEALEEWGFEPLNQLVEMGFHGFPGNAFGLAQSEDDDPWLHFVLEGVPELDLKGFRIHMEEDFRHAFVQPENYYGVLGDGEDNRWFDLEVGVVVDGVRHNLLPMLVELIQAAPEALDLRLLNQLPDHRNFLVPLPDGRLMPLPVGRVRGILGALIELYEPNGIQRDGRMRLPKLQAGQLEDLRQSLGEDRVHWEGGEHLLALGKQLKRFAGIEHVPPPRGLQATLRQYQQEGLNWLQFLRGYSLAGILADDMGLGKTVQTLAHILCEKEAGRLDHPALVVAPTSLMINWRREAQRFCPELRVLTLHGPQRKQLYGELDQHDLVLTTYPLLPRDRSVLLAKEFHLLILDEAQIIKNTKAKATQIVGELNARHRLCLTGTPMENHLGELWSLFNFLLPGFLGEERQFRRLFRTPIEKHGDSARQQALAQRIAPFMLRRTKEAVAKELPPKTEMLRSVELEGAQRDLYETIRLAMHQKVQAAIKQKGVARSQIVILEALLKLRQVCCDPRLVGMNAAERVEESAKLDLLMDLLPTLIDDGSRILLFSQFTTMLGLIEEELRATGIEYSKLTGQTKDRERAINRFQGGEVPLFLISLKAGGTGLNLTAADTVIHYDPWWNPAVMNQATDRAHRIGQDKPVFVYKLVTEGTVEQRILELQERKETLAAGLYSGQREEGPANLSPEDLDVLFKPLSGE